MELGRRGARSGTHQAMIVDRYLPGWLRTLGWATCTQIIFCREGRRAADMAAETRPAALERTMEALASVPGDL